MPNTKLSCITVGEIFPRPPLLLRWEVMPLFNSCQTFHHALTSPTTRCGHELLFLNRKLLICLPHWSCDKYLFTPLFIMFCVSDQIRFTTISATSHPLCLLTSSIHWSQCIGHTLKGFWTPSINSTSQR